MFFFCAFVEPDCCGEGEPLGPDVNTAWACHQILDAQAGGHEADAGEAATVHVVRDRF